MRVRNQKLRRAARPPTLHGLPHDRHIPARSAQLARLCRPSSAEVARWYAGARLALGGVGLRLAGVDTRCQLAAAAGLPVRLATARAIWFAWSLTHQPANLTSLFSWATWGRFNTTAPQDYRQQGLTMLRRQTGPTRAKAKAAASQPAANPPP